MYNIRGQAHAHYALVCPRVKSSVRYTYIRHGHPHAYYTWADIRILDVGMSHAYYTWANPRTI